MIKGIDCATPLTAKTAVAIAAEGYSFAARYLVPESYKWKRLTRAEAEAVTAAGMQLISVFETGASRPAGGASAGKVDGAAALKEARLIRQPEGSAIYFAVDYDAQPADYNAIEAYLKAAAAEVPGYTVGVYGSYAVIEEMARRGACKHFWQTYAWSRAKKSTRANLYQWKNGQSLAGVGVDFNEAYGGEGFWSTAPIVAPVPVAEDKYKVVVNDKLAAYGRAIDDHIYLPIRKLGDALNKAVHWDNESKTVYVDGQAVLEYRLVPRGDGMSDVYVGVRAAAELLGASVTWNGEVKKVFIYN